MSIETAGQNSIPGRSESPGRALAIAIALGQDIICFVRPQTPFVGTCNVLCVRSGYRRLMSRASVTLNGVRGDYSLQVGLSSVIRPSALGRITPYGSISSLRSGRIVGIRTFRWEKRSRIPDL